MKKLTASVLLFFLALTFCGCKWAFTLDDKEVFQFQFNDEEEEISEDEDGDEIDEEEVAEEEVDEEEIEVDEVDYVTYTNAEYIPFSFSYPEGFHFLTNGIEAKYPNGKVWYRVDMDEPDLSEKPWFRFEVNPDGYGPFFPSKVYVVSLGEDGGVVIDSEEVVEYSANVLEDIASDRNSLKADLRQEDGHDYSWMFSYAIDGEDYEPMFEKMVESFKLPLE